MKVGTSAARSATCDSLADGVELAQKFPPAPTRLKVTDSLSRRQPGSARDALGAENALAPHQASELSIKRCDNVRHHHPRALSVETEKRATQVT